MTVKSYLKKNSWKVECSTAGCRYMTVRIVFLNNRKMEDETEFDIKMYDANDLAELFAIFCQENGFNDNTVQNIYVVAAAPTHDELVEM